MIEPTIHSHISGTLPDAHPLAYVFVACEKCHAAIHDSKNKCLQTWVETGKGNYCVQCFNFLHIHEGGVLKDDWGLPDAEPAIVIGCSHEWLDAVKSAVSGTARCLWCGEIELLINVELAP